MSGSETGLQWKRKRCDLMCFVFWIVVVLILAFLKFLDKRLNVVYRNSMIITNAIHLYNIDHLFIDRIDYNCKRFYIHCLLRFWDWGYEHIVDEETFKKILPYINEEQRIKSDRRRYR